jgi:hypothetical protein
MIIEEYATARAEERKSFWLRHQKLRIIAEGGGCEIDNIVGGYFV